MMRKQFNQVKNFFKKNLQGENEARNAEI